MKNWLKKMMPIVSKRKYCEEIKNRNELILKLSIDLHKRACKSVSV